VVIVGLRAWHPPIVPTRTGGAAVAGETNLTLGTRLCRGQFRRTRLALAVAGPCHGRKAAATAVAPVRPEVKILAERLSARSFSAAMR